MALSILAMSIFAAAMRAFSLTFKIAPKIIAARMAMMAMTTSNSMRVKAERGLRDGVFITFNAGRFVLSRQVQLSHRPPVCRGFLGAGAGEGVCYGMGEP